jgi:hypothetical protein
MAKRKGRVTAKRRERVTAKRKERIVDAATNRRILRFLSGARRPEDLTVRPNSGILIMAERPTFKGPDVDEPDMKHSPVDKNQKSIIPTPDAARLLEWRNENSPIYGFLNIRQLLEVISEALLHQLVLACGPASYGQWAAPIAIPAGYDRPVHGAMLRTGKVLYFGLPNGNNTWLWDPNAGGAAAFTFPTNQPTDSLFCSGHAFLSDGRLLVVGGGGDGTVTPHTSHGWRFDPIASRWDRTAGDGSPGNGDMTYVRWYPTLVTMGDEPGRVLVASGRNGTDVSQMEVYFETTDRFERVWGPGGVGDTSADRSFPQLYPGLHMLPGGEVLYTPTGWATGGQSPPLDYPAARPSAYFEFSSTSPTVAGSWTTVGSVDSAAEDALDRVKGMAVLLLQPTYPFVQIMVLGGGQDPTSTTTYQLINLSGFHPEWGPALPLPDGLARVNVNMVLLPDSRVFVCGGRPLAGTPPNGGACWIYDPPASAWYEMDELSDARRYHSVAVLLPDARVAMAGDEEHNDRTIEVFSPPYLFNPDGSLAPRPVITSTSPTELVHHHNSFTINSPDASDIAHVVLVRPMAVTHQTDSQQRVIPLVFTQTGASSLTATMPNGWHPHGMAPRGYYMLFILNGSGVPSVGRFMFLH